MKLNKYHFYEELMPDAFLHFNSFNNRFLLLNSHWHSLLLSKSFDTIEREFHSLYSTLINSQFIIPDDYSELDEVIFRKDLMKYDSTMYQVLINMTLDCNLSCWYCYENKILNSKLSDDTIKAIEKNIQYEYLKSPFSILKISFFGGEPFMCFKQMQEILSYSQKFCANNNIRLIADFTTNATLITKEFISFLKDYECYFQIPLDGDSKIHNRIKYPIDKSFDSFKKTIDSIKFIDSEIFNHIIAIRINFDNPVLQVIDNIINDISSLHRKTSYIILKKIWQIPKDKIDRELLLQAIHKLLEAKFLVDYYVMPKGSVCLSERLRMTLFNYDGKVFKCSTLSSFDDEHTLGTLDYDTGCVQWKNNIIADWMNNPIPAYCLKCKWLPICLGPCNKQIKAHPNENICTFDSISITAKEYLMYLFKYSVLKEELSKMY
jgi:uncharacterized protein